MSLQQLYQQYSRRILDWSSKNGLLTSTARNGRRLVVAKTEAALLRDEQDTDPRFLHIEVLLTDSTFGISWCTTSSAWLLLHGYAGDIKFSHSETAADGRKVYHPSIAITAAAFEQTLCTMLERFMLADA